MTTYDKKRMAAAVLVIFIIAAAANWHFEFVFPRYSRLIVSLGVLAFLIYFTRFAPTRRDFEEHSRKHNLGTSSRAKRLEPPSPQSFGDPNVKPRTAIPDSSKFSEYYRGLADEELARIALEDHLLPEAYEALKVELHQRGLTDLGEYKRTSDQSTAAFHAWREPDTSTRAKEGWTMAVAAWVLAITLPFIAEIERQSTPITVLLTVGAIYLGLSCYLGIKDRRQGSKRGFILKFVLPLVLLSASVVSVVLCNVFLGAAFWKSLS
jgi:hypothetical protein